MLALGEGAGSLSSRPYSSPLEGAAGAWHRQGGTGGRALVTFGATVCSLGVGPTHLKSLRLGAECQFDCQLEGAKGVLSNMQLARM
jgi:hypothetical protein